MKLILFLAFLNLLAAQFSQCGADPLVRTTGELYTALGNPATTTILLNDSLAIIAKEWPRTVNLTRSVLISATAERLAASTYVLLDFKTVAMMFQLAPGITLTFRGLELANHYDTVGPTFRPLRQSIGATAVFTNCVQRRRAGLPYKAALVNMLEATRPVGVTGPQVCLIVTNFIYSSTRSSQPIVVPAAINMSDYSTTVTPDSSLAYQNLFYGGYTYTTINSYYVVDNVVSDQCLEERPGTDCVTLLLQQLDSQGQGQQRSSTQQQQQEKATGGGGSSHEQMGIIIGVVVPVVLLAATVGTFLLHRRRRRHRYLRSGQPASASTEMEYSGGGKGRVPSTLAAAAAVAGHGNGCVFMGLEEDQQLPEWSPLAADVVEEEDEEDVDDTLGRSKRGGGGGGGGEDGGGGRGGGGGTYTGGGGTGSQISDTDFIPSPMLGRGPGGFGGQSRQAASVSDCASVGTAAGSGLLRRVLSTRVDANNQGGGGGAAAAAADGGGEECVKGVGGGEAAAAAADGAAVGPCSDPSGRGCSSGVDSSGVGDMQAELGRMAQELRASVRDVAIRLEAVIGSGSFGTVYKGTWQGLSVAVKTLVFSASDDNRRRSLQEAALCASISHPNVVATYSSELQPLGALGTVTGPNSATSGEREKVPDGGMPPPPPPPPRERERERDLSQILEWRLYIIQEYADGGPLRKLYGNKALWPSPGVVNLPAVVGLALGIARALSHLHSKRIIHGDLNPNNVLLKRDVNEPSGYIVKVGDFGLSVMLPQNRTHLSNLRMGTMFYMCPAVVMKGQVGPPSDVFSLGVMLWELYHGRRAGIRTDQGPRYSSIFPAFPPSCPETYRAVALHCLQRQPQNRPPAILVEAHLERLMAAVATAVPVATPPSSPLMLPPPPPPPPPHPAQRMPAALISPVLQRAPAPGPGPPPPPAPPPPPPPPELGSLATGAAGDSFTGSSMLPSTQGHGAGASSA